MARGGALRVAIVDLAGIIGPDIVDGLRAAGVKVMAGRRPIRYSRADVIIAGLDFDLPVPPVATMACLAGSHRVVVMAASRLRADIIAAREHGAQGYVCVDAAPTALLEAVRDVAAGGQRWPAGTPEPARSRGPAPWLYRPWVWGSGIAGTAMALALASWSPWFIPQVVLPLAALLVAWLVWRQAVARHVELVARSCAHVRIRERNRYSRLLHDHTLQALEVLAASPEIRDPVLRRYLGAEAVWLRRLVKHGVAEAPLDLLAALREAIDRLPVPCPPTPHRPGRLLHVTLSLAPGLLVPELPQPAVDAIVGAVTEALTNVAKHAGASRASVLVARRPGTILVTITDEGAGFDQAGPTRPGFGLTHSIGNQMAVVGGSASIRAARGLGTVVELRYPLGRTQQAGRTHQPPGQGVTGGAARHPAVAGSS